MFRSELLIKHPDLYNELVDAFRQDYTTDEIDNMLAFATYEIYEDKLVVTYENGIVDIFSIKRVPKLTHVSNSNMRKLPCAK